jgi:hypothetical protein
MSDDPVKPGVMYGFSEPFNTQLLEAMKRPVGQPGTKADPPTPPQLVYLKKLGVTIIPRDKAEASRLIGEARKKK